MVQHSNLTSSLSSFSQVPSHTLLFKYVEALREKCKLNRLAKKVIRWYDDNSSSSNEKEFDYRFTGKDSRMFLYNFMFLIDLLEKGVSRKASQVLHIHAYLCLCLRNAVSLFTRVNITNEQIEKLNEYCRDFHYGYWLFFSVNPTVDVGTLMLTFAIVV